MDTINISIVEDHPMMISGLVTILKSYAHIKVNGAYGSAAELLQGLKEHVPDVLLLDLILPDRSGKELISEVLHTYPGLSVLVFTSLDAPSIVSSMMRRGCKGYLLKGASPEMLIDAIETVYRKEEFIEPVLRDQILQNVTRYKNKQQDMPLMTDLSEREIEILKLIAEENTTREISEKLFLSYRTIENHRYNLIQKLDVKNTAGLVRIGIQIGLIK
jgi:DNA-binding NarL/FixJ family response regulator